ncbi:MAG TPA: PQQ-binding-like beta-propeller repeat protein [Vicinamibacterales bacterium]|jgi:outer membrane protein assembly factor BamB
MNVNSRLPVVLAVAVLVPAAALLRGADWPDWRGPARSGVSTETPLPSSWSPSGQNLAWKAPYGGRSGPVIFGDRLYLQNTSGEGAMMQERLMCFHADTGKLLWEHKYNLFTSDVPPHRIAWASPVVDPATGNVFAFSGNGLLMSYTRDGKLVWERSLAEEFGMWTTHGGRVSSPIIDGDQVIVSGLMFSWGQHAGGAHRYLALDKNTGRANWFSAPEGRPTDTIYANPYVAAINGTRTFFSGGSDGAMHALKVTTGEKIWSWPVSQRGLNTAALVVNNSVIVSHSEENLGTSEMGMLAAAPVTKTGTLTDKDAVWLVRGVQAGYASPVSDGARIYIVDNGGILFAHDAKTGARVWEQNLGTIQKSSPVLADGKLYVGTENGRFYIIRPHADKAEILDQDWLGSEQNPEPIIASPAVARGRVYVASMNALYAIGPKLAPSGAPGGPVAPVKPMSESLPAGVAATVIVTPTELILKPGETIALRARAFDASGVEVALPGPVTWTVENLKGTLADGKFTADKAATAQAGVVKAAIGTQVGASRIRVIPDLPWSFDFEDGRETPPPQWANATNKFAVRDLEGNKVLVKLAENDFAFAKRCRPFFGSPELSNYTIEADVRGLERRRQLGDIGVVAQRYELVMFGNHQELHLQPWQPETARTVKVPLKWEKDIWYTIKLEVQSLDANKVRARGKVWPKGQPEPAQWTIERVDPIGSHKGAPGIYADAPSRVGGGSELYYDNIKVYKNK